mmetsp:Transcript_8445/g.14238  ORF Transcript_8445/g.14238 Transcript_8445/m.14238 type:complete len:108 (+) Transcript_8445:293-616(+)
MHLELEPTQTHTGHNTSRVLRRVHANWLKKSSPVLAAFLAGDAAAAAEGWEEREPEDDPPAESPPEDDDREDSPDDKPPGFGSGRPGSLADRTEPPTPSMVPLLLNV